MQVRSINFGELTYSAEDVLHFEEALPGFPTLKDFILLTNEEFQPFHYLQAVNDPPIAFTLINPCLIKKDYHVTLTAEDVRQIRAENPEDLLIYAIVTIPERVEHTTMNLLAPVILNARHMTGKQVILHGSDYPVRFPLLAEHQIASGE